MSIQPTTTPQGLLSEGDTIHFKRSITAWGYIRGKGETVVLTAQMIEDTVDRLGRSWLDQVDDEDARIGRGVWPDGEPRWSYGSPDWEESREASRRLAWSHVDPRVRAEALANVDAIYGPSLPTSKTFNSAEDPSIRQAEMQEQRRRQAGVQLRSSFTPSERVNP